MRKIPLICVFLLVPVFGIPDTKIFMTVDEVIVFFDEFHEENNTYEQLDEDPKHIRLSPKIVESEHEDNIRAAVERAIIHGVIRTFVHTSINEIKVTAVPVVLEIGKPKLNNLMPAYSQTMTASRGQVETALRKMAGLTLNDLVTDKEIGGTTFSNIWTDEFEAIYYNDANRNSFFELLKK